MVLYDFNGEVGIYLDDGLRKNIDTKIIPDLKKKEFDVVFAVTGRERIGKSTFAQTIGGYIAKQLGTNFDMSNICMTPDELQKRIEHSSKNEVIIFDEAHRGMSSSRSLSEVNNILKNLFMEMGQFNLCVIVILPSYFMLDKYVAIHRTRGLFYIYERGRWVYYNEDHKRMLYIKGKKNMDMNCMKFPSLRGRCYTKTPLNRELYIEKKRESFKNSENTGKRNKYITQRNILITYIVKKLKQTQVSVAETLTDHQCPITFQDISLIIAQNSDMYPESSSFKS